MLEKLTRLKQSLGKQSSFVTEADLDKRAREREVGATIVAEREEEKRRIQLQEEAARVRSQKKQALIDSLFGGSAERQDPNAGLASFVQRIVGGGASGNDARKMVIEVKAEEVDPVSDRYAQERPPSTRLRFFSKPKPMVATMDALNKPANKEIKDKLPRKK